LDQDGRNHKSTGKPSAAKYFGMRQRTVISSCPDKSVFFAEFWQNDQLCLRMFRIVCAYKLCGHLLWPDPETITLKNSNGARA
jgi:hypothetical protein